MRKKEEDPAEAALREAVADPEIVAMLVAIRKVDGGETREIETLFLINHILQKMNNDSIGRIVRYLHDRYGDRALHPDAKSRKS